jgi:hypothetical protein
MFENAHPAVIVTSVVGGAFFLALVAVVLSTKANTSGVISSATQGLSSIIGAAVSPITGGTSGTGSLVTNPTAPSA